jgi:hypothetical protein
MSDETDRLFNGIDCSTTFMLDRIKIYTSSALVSGNLSISLVLIPESFSCTISFPIWVYLGIVWIQWIWDMLTLTGSISDKIHIAFVISFSARAVGSGSYSFVFITVKALRILLSSGVSNFLA